MPLIEPPSSETRRSAKWRAREDPGGSVAASPPGEVRNVTEAQRIVLPPRVAAFHVVCEACRGRQPLTGADYRRSIVARELPPDQDHGAVVCRRGHVIELVRESPAAILR
jgi:hypothetical protein